jgi:hypothetical protein
VITREERRWLRAVARFPNCWSDQIARIVFAHDRYYYHYPTRGEYESYFNMLESLAARKLVIRTNGWIITAKGRKYL